VETIQKYSDITPEKIQDWKAKYGMDALQELTVVVKSDKKNVEDKEVVSQQLAKYIVRTPTRTVLDVVGQHGIDKDVAKSNKALIANCVLGGDMDVLEQDGGVYAAVLKQIQNLITTKEVSIKKL